jgi:hypothetical protein
VFQSKQPADRASSENPQPPCARCTREQKICTFAEERRRKRPGDSDRNSIDGNDSEAESFTDVNGVKRQRLVSFGGPRVFQSPANVRTTPNRRQNGNSITTDDEEDPQVSNRSASMIQSAEVFSQNDALQLLYKAAQHTRTNSTSSAFPGRASNDATPSSHATSPNGIMPRNATGRPTFNSAVEGPAHAASPLTVALATWSRFRFVRAGWIKAEEGIAFIEYFYEHLHPLTPITIPDYRDPSTHKDLLEQEPILALTLLAIASRYMNPPGPGGTSRGPIIHETLTNSIQKEINRTVWGQKQFGGGICRAGAGSKGRVNHQWQTLGTIESLMLLTEWHPRSLHFPPGDDDGELLIPEDSAYNTAPEEESIRIGGPEGRRVDAWLEPCWRSDRMCWMLLGVAKTLAYEIGVYEEITEAEFRQNNPDLPEYKVKSYYKRKNHLKDLLPVYSAMTSGRLELTKNVPGSYLDHLPKTKQMRLNARLAKLGLQQAADETPYAYSAHLRLLEAYPQELVIHFWQELAYILNLGNQQMYPNRKSTAELVATGRYVQLLQFYQPLLNDWYRDFSNCKSSKFCKHLAK